MADNPRSLNRHLSDIDDYLRLVDGRLAVFSSQDRLQSSQLADGNRAPLADPTSSATPRAPLAQDRCPYRGLEQFDETHAGDYHGRSAMVARVLARLRETSFVTVVGPSGCGKSSLIRAGLLPALQRVASWDIAMLRPGPDPLFGLAIPLAARLAPALMPAERLLNARRLSEQLLDSDGHVDGVLDRIRQQNPGAPRLALIVDQLEEAFTFCGSEALRQAFLNALLRAADSSWVTVIVALRADLFGRALAERALGPRVDCGQVNVLPMTPEERREAIVQPASRLGRTFESGLVERIAGDVENLPAELPSMQVALTELWVRQRGDGVLTHASYEAIGGARGAIPTWAGAIYHHLAPAEQDSVRAAFRRLVEVALPDEGVGDSLRRVALAEAAPGNEPLVRQLIARRLLLAARDPETRRETVELVHEALLREWQPLREWLNRDREFLLWRQRLRAQAVLWDESGHSQEQLLRGAQLLAAIARWGEWQANLDTLERAFVVASRQQMAQDATMRREETEAEVEVQPSGARDQTEVKGRQRAVGSRPSAAWWLPSSWSWLSSFRRVAPRSVKPTRRRPS